MMGAHSLWQGFNIIFGYKLSPSQICFKSSSLPDELNSFYACFEAQMTTQTQVFLPKSKDQVLKLSTADVKRTFMRINSPKALGTANIFGLVLKDCTDQQKYVFMTFINLQLCAAAPDIIVPVL